MYSVMLLMSDDMFLICALVVPFFIMVIGLAIYFLFQYPKDKAKNEARKQAFYEECEKELEYDFVKATVLSKKKDSYYKQELRMIEVPALKEDCYITFLTEKDEEVTYPVRQEIFERVEEGQEGTLVTVNGNFFDFGDGVDVADEEAPETIEE